MTPDQCISILTARSADYFGIMRTTLFALTGIVAIIQLGPDSYSTPLTMLVIATAAYGILAGGTALDDIINLRDDMDDDMAKSSYGTGVNARNIPAIKITSAVFLGLIGLVEFFAILI